jgi:guanosine-3',5'-bis(diphosphate) 3'-pyrophosphohydrolase
MDLSQFLSELMDMKYGINQDHVRTAYELAEKGHAGETRKGGGSYLEHPVAVALLLKESSDSVICAALLHDLVENTDITLEQIRDTFGEEVAFLVDGVTKYPKPKNRDYDRAAYREKNHKKLLRYIKQDKRVLLIKLADRYNNLTTLHVFRKEKQQRIAKETLDFYIPLAETYGFAQFKAKLQKLAEEYL